VLRGHLADAAYQRYAASLESARNAYDEHLRYSMADRMPDLLRFEDRNSMAFSVEARTPFLDVRLVELAFGGAAPYRIRDGWTKWVLRRAAERRLPEEVTWRRGKIGFETPERRWLANWPGGLPVAETVDALDRYVNPHRAGSALRSAAAGTARGETSALAWRLLVAASWIRQWGT